MTLVWKVWWYLAETAGKVSDGEFTSGSRLSVGYCMKHILGSCDIHVDVVNGISITDCNHTELVQRQACSFPDCANVNIQHAHASAAHTQTPDGAIGMHSVGQAACNLVESLVGQYAPTL